MLVVGDDPQAVEADLVGGRLACPGCGGTLGRYGWARWRQVRTFDGEQSLRPRRGWCKRCGAAHVLLPAWSAPRRRDGTEVIVAALVAKAAGSGHRTIAAVLGRPASTVRGWLRRAASRAEATRVAATVWVRALDGGTPAGVSSTPLGDALDALGSALAAARRRLGPPGSAGVLALSAALVAPDGSGIVVPVECRYSLRAPDR